MKIVNIFKRIVILLLFLPIVTASAMVAKTGCESLSNSKWFARALLTPQNQSGPKIPATIIINIHNVTLWGTQPGGRAFNLDGTMNQLPIQMGICKESARYGTLLNVVFTAQSSGQGYTVVGDGTQQGTDPSVLPLPPNSITLYINGVIYNNENEARLIRE